MTFRLADEMDKCSADLRVQVLDDVRFLGFGEVLEQGVVLL
jgi:hypothetical protein